MSNNNEAYNSLKNNGGLRHKDIEPTINSLREIAEYAFDVLYEESEHEYIECAETLISAAEELTRLAEYLRTRGKKNG